MTMTLSSEITTDLLFEEYVLFLREKKIYVGRHRYDLLKEIIKKGINSSNGYISVTDISKRLGLERKEVQSYIAFLVREKILSLDFTTENDRFYYLTDYHFNEIESLNDKLSDQLTKEIEEIKMIEKEEN